MQKAESLALLERLFGLSLRSRCLKLRRCGDQIAMATTAGIGRVTSQYYLTDIEPSASAKLKNVSCSAFGRWAARRWV